MIDWGVVFSMKIREKIRRKMNSLKGLWNIIKSGNMHMMRVREKREEKKMKK